MAPDITGLDPAAVVRLISEGFFRVGSELADTGQTVDVAGTEKLAPGTYDFLCQPHPGMKGKLVVR